MVLSIASENTQELNLNNYHWQNRIVLLYKNGDQEALEQQKNMILADEEGIKERHLLIFIVEENTIHQLFSDARFETSRSVENYNKGADNTLQFVLIGKDGGMKMRESGTVSLKQLYAVIDAMPMRRSEMRQ